MKEDKLEYEVTIHQLPLEELIIVLSFLSNQKLNSLENITVSTKERSDVK